jgi:uncharacterized protein (DUF2147 family)
MIPRSCSLGRAAVPSFACAVLLAGAANCAVSPAHAASAASAANAAASAAPSGEWLVEKGYATIRIVDCNGEFWGVVASEQKPGGTDKNNPDPRLRSRPTLGMPILLGMKPSNSNEWSGEIYNSQDGRTYSASINLLNSDTLKVQGCVMGFLCGGENWTRVTSDKTSAAQPGQRPGTAGARPTSPGKSATGARPSTAPQAEASPQTQSAEEICSSLVGLPGSTHERRLK